MRQNLITIVHYSLSGCRRFPAPHFVWYNRVMKKIIIENDGWEMEYSSLSECAKALGVSPATIYGCASYGYKCHGYNVRYSDGTMRTRKRKSTAKFAKKTTADEVLKMIADWYTQEWKEYISSDALVSLTAYIKEHWN